MPNYLSSLFGSHVCFAGDNCNAFLFLLSYLQMRGSLTLQGSWKGHIHISGQNIFSIL